MNSTEDRRDLLTRLAVVRQHLTTNVPNVVGAINELAEIVQALLIEQQVEQRHEAKPGVTITCLTIPPELGEKIDQARRNRSMILVDGANYGRAWYTPSQFAREIQGGFYQSLDPRCVRVKPISQCEEELYQTEMTNAAIRESIDQYVGQDPS